MASQRWKLTTLKTNNKKKIQKLFPRKQALKLAMFFFSKQIPKLLEQQQIETHKNGVKPFITY